MQPNKEREKENIKRTWTLERGDNSPFGKKMTQSIQLRQHGSGFQKILGLFFRGPITLSNQSDGA